MSQKLSMQCPKTQVSNKVSVTSIAVFIFFFMSKFSSSFSAARTINVESPIKPEMKSKLQSHDLNKLFQDRMAEYAQIQTNWGVKDIEYRRKTEDLISQIREIQEEKNNTIIYDRKAHLKQIQELTEKYQESIRDLQAELDRNLNESEADNDFDEMDAEIKALRENLKNAEPMAAFDDNSDENSDIDLDGELEERINELESNLAKLQEIYEEHVENREEVANENTDMIKSVIGKFESVQEEHKKEIESIVADLNHYSDKQSEKAKELEQKVLENKKSVANQLKNSLQSISRLEKAITQTQKENNREMTKLQTEADRLRIALETITARQKQQMKETAAASKKYGEEKRKFITRHKELELLHSELVRETVEHQTLLKELNKMDNALLSQSAFGSSKGSSSFSLSRSKYI